MFSHSHFSLLLYYFCCSFSELLLVVKYGQIAHHKVACRGLEEIAKILTEHAPNIDLKDKVLILIFFVSFFFLCCCCF